MNIEKYNELTQREEKLNEDYNNFIIDTLNKYGGRMSLRKEEEPETDSPIILTMYGNKGGNYNIAITDVFIQKDSLGNTEIYANGIDQEDSDYLENFSVYPEHLSGIAHFLNHILTEVTNFAEQLALKECVDKYSKLPEALVDDNKIILLEYAEFYNEKLGKYKLEFIQLTVKCSSGKYDWDEIKNEISELACEISDLKLIENNQKPIEDLCDFEGDSSTYKEEIQDEFNGIFDDVEGELATLIGFEL